MRTSEIYDKLKDSLSDEAARELAEILTDIYNKLQDFVTKGEFNYLAKMVSELIEIQKRTEEKVADLAEAQKRTEEKVADLAEVQTRTEKQVADLAEAQKRTEKQVADLAEAQKMIEKQVADLVEAQKRTEEKVAYLAEAQKRTEKQVADLAEAQRKTEIILQNLIKDHNNTKKMVAGLSDTVGYTLENAAYKSLPELLKRDYNIIIKEKLKRTFVMNNDGDMIEVNIYGKGEMNGKLITIIGESKVHISKNKIDKFIRKKIQKLDKIYDNIFPILVTHMITEHDAEEYAKRKGIAVYYSYDF